MSSPFLSPLSASPNVALATRTPSSFKPIVGTPSNVAFSDFKHGKGRGHTAAQKAGLKYEERVLEKLSQEFPLGFRAQPSINYSDSSGRRLAIPDGILRYRDSVVIVEIKYSHCELAWWQLRKLYQPLLLHLTNYHISLLEICKSYDPSVAFPEPVQLISSLEELSPDNDQVKVLQWKI